MPESTQLDQVTEQLRDHEERIRHLETRGAGDGEKFTTLFNMIARLEATVNRLVTDMDQRLRALELKPAGNWDRLVWAALSAGVAAFVTWLTMRGGTP